MCPQALCLTTPLMSATKGQEEARAEECGVVVCLVWRAAWRPGVGGRLVENTAICIQLETMKHQAVTVTMPDEEVEVVLLGCDCVMGGPGTPFEPADPVTAAVNEALEGLAVTTRFQRRNQGPPHAQTWL